MVEKNRVMSAARTTQVIAHFRTPLYRNAYALIFSSASTSVLGAAYWLLATHNYTADTVGLNSAAISAMTFLAGVSQLNLMSALARFIPEIGRGTDRFAIGSYLVTVVVAAVAGLVFILGLNLWAPALYDFRSSPVLALWFILSTMAYCVFILQDSVLTGLRQAVWVPVENVSFSLLKIALLVGFVGLLPQYGVFISWTVAVMAFLLPVNFLIFRRLIPAHVRENQDRATSLQLKQVVQYVSGDYVGLLCWLAATTLLPVIVLREAGAVATAYFYLAWTIAYSLYLVSSGMGYSLLVEAARDRSKLRVYSYRAGIQCARLVVPSSIILALGAPYILQIFGSGYSAEGTTLLRLLALSAIPNIITALFTSIARAQRRVAAIVAVAATICTLVLTLSHIFMDVYGITGVGLAWLVSQVVVAGVIVLTQLRPLWSGRNQALGK